MRWCNPGSALGLLALVMFTACAPTAPASPSSPGAVPVVQPSAPQRTLRLVARVEPGAATPRVDQSSGIVQDMAARLFVAGLTYLDDQEGLHPYLAEELPQLNTGSWKVFPDGRMETTYKLRPGLTWHDGAPLTAQDFLFALRLYRDPLANSIFKPTVESFIDDLEAPDDRTIVFKWNAPYALAGQQGANKESFHPMPRHLLESALIN